MAKLTAISTTHPNLFIGLMFVLPRQAPKANAYILIKDNGWVPIQLLPTDL